MIPKALLIIVSIFAGVEDPVTHLGRQLLPKTDLIAKGEVDEASRVGAAGILVRFSVSEVLLGEEESERVLLISPDPFFFPEKRTPCVLFLRRLGKARYEPVARVDLRGGVASTKLSTLKRYLEVEGMEDAAAKRKAFHDVLMQHVASEDRFRIYSAARELAHFTEESREYFTGKDADIIEDRAAGTGDALLRDLLRTALVNLGRGAPSPGRRGIARGRTRDEAELRELSKRWAERPDARRRLELIRLLCVRHLKRAGPLLLSAVRDQDPRVREMAARNLGEAGVTEAVEPLLALLSRERAKGVLRAAIHSLGILRHRPAFPTIITLGEDPELLRAVAFAAARIGGDEAREFLEGLRAAHGSASDRHRAIRTLVDFLLSEEFAKQEAAMAKIRARRLR